MQQHHDLSRQNSLAMPISCAYYAAPKSLEELQILIQEDIWQQQPKIILGGGTNIFFTKDFQGLVIHPKFHGIDLVSENETQACIEFAAAEDWDKCVEYCVQNNYFGIENLSGIPGNIGASPVQNIGAYGVELGDVLEYVKIIDITTGKITKLTKTECKLGYRDSIFKHEYKDKKLIYAVGLSLSKNFSSNLQYKDLQQYLLDNRIDENAANIRTAVLAVRDSKLPNHNILPNAGSFFKNPLISKEQATVLHKDYPIMPQFTVGDLVKVPAGWLIEKSGMKGIQHHGVGTHVNHALVITNHNSGTSTQMLELIAMITEAVHTNFGIKLEPEVRII